MKIRSITYGDILKFKEIRLQAPHQHTGKLRSPTSTNRELETLRAVLRFAVGNNWLARSPFTGPAPIVTKTIETSRERIPTQAEQEAILAQCVPPRAHLRPILIALADTGLRKSALLSLTWKLVDFENGDIRIPKGLETRSGRRSLG